MVTVQVAQSSRGARDVTKSGIPSPKIDHLMLLMAQQTEKQVEFVLEAKHGSKVYIAGTFNEWNPTSHPLRYHPEDGTFKAKLLLPTGTHEYKFIVDGAWRIDIRCPNWVLNDNGTLNSVLKI